MTEAIRVVVPGSSVGIPSPEVTVIRIVESGPQGIQGPAGGSSAPYTAQAGEDIPAGAPVRIDQVTFKLMRAGAAAMATSTVVGLLSSAVANTFAGTVVRDRVIMADWTSIVGVAALSPGLTYFLSATAGMLSAVPPAIAGQSIAIVGVALDAATMIISIQESILL
jgi:hypothetical protein